MQPPEVIITTPIYHPNVNEKNRLCDQRLNATSLWDNKATLIEVLEIIVDALDNPKAEDSPANTDAAKEFIQNRAEYERKSTAMIQKNGLPRS
ncbi:unnamed protein product [Rotaria sordida]|uniref:UBC core domain-containing protein n=1 Tax=Rotaria sordida TaxID=392033 RepID=A0A814J5Z3_9BILA|nr:unnamed protein product [Rotaria sordida]CAF1033071.1 unnamed protein product [Rotaria sordida]CAF1034059.1 unnamed protein product [Rotaria sordida]